MLPDDLFRQCQSPITDEDINLSLFSMGPSKAAGPDGITAAFFQKMWKVTSKCIRAFAQILFNTGNLPPGTNDTLLTLVPKLFRPQLISQLRPISLCNVTYKVNG